MATGLFIWNLKSRFYLLIILFLFFGCSKSKNKNKEKLKINLKNIENGFLICRLGSGYFSNYFRKFASKEQKYSHIGIISKENDSIYVYHSEASEFTGTGFVKKETLNSFLKGILIYDFFKFKYPDSTKANILKSVKKYYNKKTPFDLNFNSFDDNELYCTELIATSVNNNIIDSNKIMPNLLLNGKKLYSLDDIYLNKNVKKITFPNNNY